MSISAEAEENRPKKPLNAYFTFRIQKMKEYASDEKRHEKVRAEWMNIDENVKEKMEKKFHEDLEKWMIAHKKWIEKYNIVEGDVKKNKSKVKESEIVEKSSGDSQILLRKNQELLRALQDKERQLNELRAEKGKEVAKLRQDCTNLGQQNNHLSYLLSKLRQQLAEKDLSIGRSISDNQSSELIAVKQQLQQKKQENIQLISAVREIKTSWKEAEGYWQHRKREMLDRQSTLQNEVRKYKDEYHKICVILTSQMNNPIDSAPYKQ